MAARRRNSKPSSDPPLPSQPSTGGKLRNIVFGSLLVGFLLIWLIVWASRHLYSSGEPTQAHPRWHLIVATVLVPDETLAAWFDGEISIRGVIDRLWIMVVILIVTLPGAWLGYQALAASGVTRRTTCIEYWMLALAVGLSIHATLVLGAGLAGVVSHRLAMPGIAIFELACAVILRLRFGSSHLRSTPVARNIRSVVRKRWLPLLLLSLAMLLVGARCITPPAEFDVLEYHVGAPKEWLLSGQIEYSPHNIYANMPMAAEMQTLSAMSWSRTLGTADAWWWGGLVGKAMMFVYWALAIGLSGCLVRRIAGRDVAWWTIAVAASGTALAEVTALGLIEAAVACYFSASLLVLVIGRRELATNPATVFWIGFMAGSAFACKYPALLFVCLPVGVLTALRRCYCDRSAAGILFGAGCFLLGCALTASPWLAKNTVLAGNPVYPLAASALGGKTMTPEKIAQWNAAHTPSSRSISKLVGALKNIAWSWKSQDALIVPLALLSILTIRRNKITGIAVSMALFTLAVWWLLTHHLERFLLPAAPIAIVLSGMGIGMIQKQLSHRWAAVLLTMGIACNLCMLSVSPLMGDPRILVDPSDLRREAFTTAESNRIPSHVLWANQTLKGTSTALLLVGDAATFNYEVPVLYSTCFDRSPLMEIIQGYPPEQWREQFAQRGIGHVLVHWGEIQRYRSPGNYGFDASISQELLEDLVERGVIRRVATDLDPSIAEAFVVGEDAK